ncbi:MAG: ribonuclease Z [Bacteroidetes bacterium]|nr:ribonuclease Z [Bacteroidota bacterium]MBT6687538.1 ribonuclease Z [Bacteroidota bacterium]MBT7142769.1 ribonuclease Z [Bacteroidota bacterium]MBT7491972.1 ribonuclease Z [Bacteroidota bacterium]
MYSFQLRILGSNSALPTSTKFSTAHILNICERFFLIDCGEGTQIQIRKFKIKFNKINHIFISHLHGDHYFGLFGLISTFNLIGRKNDLNIHCNKDLENIINFLFKNYAEDLSFKINFHHLKYDKSYLIFEDDKLTIHSFPLKHRIQTCGFLFSEKQKDKKFKKELIDYYNIQIKDIVKIKQGADLILEHGKIIPNSELTYPPEKARSFAFCSDTAYTEEIVEYISNVDLLYHEATFKHDLKEMAKKTFHSTNVQAATIAKKANAKKLLIGHFSSRYKDTSEIIEEAREVFPNTFITNDGDVFEP